MSASTKLSKNFLKLLNLVRLKDENIKIQLTKIYCKNNILYSTDGKLPIRCDLKYKDLPKYEFDDGFYEVSGQYLIRDKDFKDYKYPDVECLLDTEYEKYFQISENNAHLDFLHTVTSNNIFFDFVRFEKQFKQLFKGTNFKVYFINGEKQLLIECDYVVNHIIDALYSPIQVILMPMKHEQDEPISLINYNPVREAEEVR